MKVFINAEGKIVGSYESNKSGVEDLASMPETTIGVVPQELVDRFNDPFDEAHPLGCIVVDGNIISIESPDTEQISTNK